MGGPKGGSPKFRAFFSFSRPRFHSFFSLWGSSCLFFLSPDVFSCLFSSLWVSSRGILVVFWSVGTSNVLVFALRLGAGEGKKNAKFWAVRRRAPKLAQIGLARPKSGWPPKVRKAMAQIGQGNTGGQSWPKSACPDQNRPKSASLRLSPKSQGRPGRGQSGSWPKKVVAKVGHTRSLWRVHGRHLVVIALEVGGLWLTETRSFELPGARRGWRDLNRH